jgi:hypothetical protein
MFIADAPQKGAGFAIGIRVEPSEASNKVSADQNQSMIRKSGYRFSEKIMLKQVKTERDDDSKKSHPALEERFRELICPFKY